MIYYGTISVDTGNFSITVNNDHGVAYMTHYNKGTTDIEHPGGIAYPFIKNNEIFIVSPIEVGIMLYKVDQVSGCLEELQNFNIMEFMKFLNLTD